VMDQRLHVVLHLDPARRRDLVVVDHDRARILLEPLDALLDDARRLAQLLDTDEVAIVAVAVLADGNVEIELIVDFVWLVLAQIPYDARAPQHRAREAELHRALWRYDADIDRALLPDAVIRQKRLVLVDAGRKAVHEVFDEVEERAAARLVHLLELLRGAIRRR